jgi:glutathione synthase/RimK-type ligase-like ATP-grasp enzyme
VLPNDTHAVLSMRRDIQTLRWLETVATGSVRIINSPKSVRRCRRLNMLTRLRKHGLPVAPFQLLGTSEAPDLAFGWPSGGVWVKRSDYHCLHQGLDVVHIPLARSLPAALEAFRGRSLTDAIVQAHAPGVTVKCYAVGSGQFRCFPEIPSLAPFVSQVVAHIRAVFGLDVFGVDLIVGAGPDVAIVDVNDWPSFAPCLEFGGAVIAAHALRRLRLST